MLSQRPVILSEALIDHGFSRWREARGAKDPLCPVILSEGARPSRRTPRSLAPATPLILSRRTPPQKILWKFPSAPHRVPSLFSSPARTAYPLLHPFGALTLAAKSSYIRLTSRSSQPHNQLQIRTFVENRKVEPKTRYTRLRYNIWCLGIDRPYIQAYCDNPKRRSAPQNEAGRPQARPSGSGGRGDLRFPPPPECEGEHHAPRPFDRRSALAVILNRSRPARSAPRLPLFADVGSAGRFPHPAVEISGRDCCRHFPAARSTGSRSLSSTSS